MRFCEKCEETKPFTIADIQPICDDCSHAWISLHSTVGHKTEEHKELLLRDQSNDCRFCGKYLETIGKAVYHEENGYRYAAFCSSCIGRLKFLRFDPKIIKDMINSLGYYIAHQETLTVKDKKWLSVCETSGPLFSTCCKGQYFAIIIGEDGEQLSEGWNGVPPGEMHCSQGGCERPVILTASNSSYIDCTAQHAEVNALLNVPKHALKGATLYVNGTPCHECARAIIHSGIKRVVFIPQEKYSYEDTIKFMGRYGVSMVYVDSLTTLEYIKDQAMKNIRSTYKSNTDLVDDIGFAKEMLSYLHFNQLMGRVSRCI